MLTSVRGLLAATVLAGAAFAAAPAMAQDEESAVSVSGNVALVTDYRFRGLGLSGGDPAIQGGIDVSLPAGFYVGTWGSSIDDGGTGLYGEMELDLYGGWAGDITEGVGADVGVIYYAYPANDFGPADYFEIYASVSPSVGPATFTLGAAYSPDQDSLGSTDNLYLYTDVAIAIPETPISVTGHVGYTDGFLTFTSDGDAFDYSVGASVTVLGGLTLGVSYVGVDDDGLDLQGVTDDTVVGSLGFAF